MTGYVWRGKPDLEEQNAAILAARRREGRKGAPNVRAFSETAQHGTRSGYVIHKRLGQQTCEACRAANNERARADRVRRQRLRALRNVVESARVQHEARAVKDSADKAELERIGEDRRAELARALGRPLPVTAPEGAERTSA